MKGYILNIIGAIRQDLIVKVLSNGKYYTLYRFYGARHSVLHVGRKIDFEVEYDKVYMPRLRCILHIGNKFELDSFRMYVWQKFVRLLDAHLDGVVDCDDFYFNLLENGSRLMQRQNPMRVACQMQSEILKFEGRSYSSPSCFICEGLLQDEVAVARGYILAHPHCLPSSFVMSKELVLDFLRSRTSIGVDDVSLLGLYKVLLQGI